MRSEIQHFLEHVSSDETMETFMKRQNASGLQELFDHLEFAKPEVEAKWLQAYRKIEQQITNPTIKETTILAPI